LQGLFARFYILLTLSCEPSGKRSFAFPKGASGETSNAMPRMRLQGADPGFFHAVRRTAKIDRPQG